MIPLSNVHTHSFYCDGKASLRRMINEAIDLGFVSLGFSGHSPLPYYNGYAMTIQGEQEYIREVKALKEEYQEKLEILLGVEWDLDSVTSAEDYDYRIGSVHQIHGPEEIYAVDNTLEELKTCLHDVFKDNWKLMVEEYYNLVIKNALRPSVDIVGHFDLITKLNEGNVLFPEDSPIYQSIAAEALKIIVRSRPNLVFEINTGAMYRIGKKEPYPASFLLKLLGKMGSRVVITSDAHVSEALTYGFSEAINICRDNGVKNICILRKEGFVSFPGKHI